MSIYYMDPESGNDATTATPLGWWSLAYTGAAGTAPAIGELGTGATSGATARCTIAPVGWPADGTLYFYGKSGTFTGGGGETVDFAGGGSCNVVGDATYCAWKTITSGATAARIAAGDVIRIKKSLAPTSLGQTATWNQYSKVVTLTSAVTANVSTCNNAWTAAPNVTCSTDTTNYKMGTSNGKANNRSTTIAPAAAHVTGLAAYEAMAATDFNSYQQLSFWARSTVALAAGDYRINLCSDAVGAVPVDSFDLPAVPCINTWQNVVVDKAAGMGAAIQSVALYAMVDKGALTINLDNIIACKATGSADSVTLASLISKNSSEQADFAGELWYPIQSINGTTILIDNQSSTTGAAGRGYEGATENVTTYKRECFKTTPAASSTATVQEIQDSGSDGSPIEFQGGYDPVTNLQTGETIFDGQNSQGRSVYSSAKLFLTLNRIGGVRYGSSIYLATTFGIEITNSGINCACSSYGVYIAGATSLSTCGYVGCNNGDTGLTLISNHVVAQCKGHNHTSTNYGGIYILGGIGTILEAVTHNNTTAGVTFQNTSGTKIMKLTTGNNGSAFKSFYAAITNHINNFDTTDSTIITSAVTRFDDQVAIRNYGLSATDHRIYSQGFVAYSDQTVRHTASGYSWKLCPTSTTNRTQYWPGWIKIARVWATVSVPITVSAWFRRDNAGITGSLVARANQLGGPSTEQKSSMTVAADTWEQLSVTWTPTASGVVEIEAQAYGGTTYAVYIDDLTVSSSIVPSAMLGLDLVDWGLPFVTNVGQISDYLLGCQG